MKKYKIIEIHAPIDYWNKEKRHGFIIEKRSWFGWKRLCKIRAYVTIISWIYFNKDLTYMFKTKKDAILYLKTIHGKLDVEICGDMKIQF